MSSKEYQKYKKDCLSNNIKSKDCDDIDPDTLSDKEVKMVNLKKNYVTIHYFSTRNTNETVLALANRPAVRTRIQMKCPEVNTRNTRGSVSIVLLRRIVMMSMLMN